MPSDAELREMLATTLARAEAEGFTPETEQVFMDHLPALLTRIEVLEKAARTLIAKLDECAPGIDDAFLHRELRCGPYEGPNYAVELAALRGLVEGDGK